MFQMVNCRSKLTRCIYWSNRLLYFNIVSIIYIRRGNAQFPLKKRVECGKQWQKHDKEEDVHNPQPYEYYDKPHLMFHTSGSSPENPCEKTSFPFSTPPKIYILCMFLFGGLVNRRDSSISSSLTPFSRRDSNDGADRLDVARWWICGFSHGLLCFFQVCQSHTLPAQSKNKSLRDLILYSKLNSFLVKICCLSIKK